MNIWEIKSFDELDEILSDNINSITIVGLSLNHNKIIRRFLKEKSQLYKYITFVYFTVPDTTNNVCKEDVDNFPYVYHIHNKNKIVVKIENANLETLEDSFNKVIGEYDIRLNKEKMINIEKYKENAQKFNENILEDLKERKCNN